MMRRALEESEK